MRDVYEYCPKFENDKYLLRLISTEDTNDLLKVFKMELKDTKSMVL